MSYHSDEINKNRKTKVEKLSELDLYDLFLEGTLSSITAKLTEEVSKYPNHVVKFILETRWYFDDQESYIEVNGTRDETDEEVIARLRKRDSAKIAAAKRKKDQREREKALYEKLKKKYEAD